MRAIQPAIAGFGDKGRGHEPRKVGDHSKEGDHPHMIPSREMPSQSNDFEEIIPSTILISRKLEFP